MVDKSILVGHGVGPEQCSKMEAQSWVSQQRVQRDTDGETGRRREGLDRTCYANATNANANSTRRMSFGTCSSQDLCLNRELSLLDPGKCWRYDWTGNQKGTIKRLHIGSMITLTKLRIGTRKSTNPPAGGVSNLEQEPTLRSERERLPSPRK